MASGLPPVPFACAVQTVVASADAVSVCGSEPPNHPPFFKGGLERFEFLLQHTFFVRVRGGVFLGAGLGVGILLPVGVDKSILLR